MQAIKAIDRLNVDLVIATASCPNCGHRIDSVSDPMISVVLTPTDPPRAPAELGHRSRSWRGAPIT